MKLLKLHKQIDINKSIGHVRLTATHYAKPLENSNQWEYYTIIHCWYDRDCEYCTMSWENRSYEGECNDCGCIFNKDFDTPIWKCMLPAWIKRRLIKHCTK